MTDKRSKERAREHGPHGWTRSPRAHLPRHGLVFIDCPCGWFGYVDEVGAPPLPSTRN